MDTPTKLSHAQKDELLIKEANEKFETEGGKFTHTQIHDALFYLYDMFDRGLVKWVLVGDVAKQLYKVDLPSFSADRIEAVVLKKDWTKSGESMVKSIIKDWKHEYNIFSFEHKGVPIEVKILEGTYNIFDNPMQQGYMLEEFYLPNPFHRYLDIADQIR